MALQCLSLTALLQCSPFKTLMFKYLSLSPFVHIVTKQALLLSSGSQLLGWFSWLPAFLHFHLCLVSCLPQTCYRAAKSYPQTCHSLLSFVSFYMLLLQSGIPFPLHPLIFRSNIFSCEIFRTLFCSVNCSLIYVPWAHCAVPHYSTYYTLLWTSVCLSSPEDKESSVLFISRVPGGAQHKMLPELRNLFTGKPYVFLMRGKAYSVLICAVLVWQRCIKLLCGSGMLQVEFPQKQTLRWKFTCRMSVTESSWDRHLWN